MQIETPDGTHLGATLVRGARDDRWVVIGGATAVPHSYYRPISEWLAERLGANVLSFDYRDVGASRGGAPLRESEADYRDWAADLEAAIDWAAERGRVVTMGHSFGGHAFGMTSAHERTLGLYTFATGAGWAGHMPALEGLKVRFMWNVLGPVFVGVKGYLPFSALNMGEDLPRGVYADWRKWCSYPNYFFDDVEADFDVRFARVEVPVVGVNSVDDAWANPTSASAFLSHYPNHTLVETGPREIGVGSIGHMSYVRPKCEALWAPLADFFEERFASVGV